MIDEIKPTSDNALPIVKPALAKTPLADPPSRRKRYLVLAACVAFILIAAPFTLFLWASAAGTQEFVRQRMVAELEKATGARVQIGAFHWHLFNLEADAEGVTLHGKEAPAELPLASIGRLDARISILGLLSPRVLLRDLEVSQPAFHLIVYADGSTNVPEPHKPMKHDKPALDTLFDLKANHVAVQHGVFDFENRVAEFDSQNRLTLLEFDARDVSALMRYMPPVAGNPETYRIETGAADLSTFRAKEKPSLGSMQATLDLNRNAAYLRSFTLTERIPAARGHREETHTLQTSGQLQNFSHPTWTAKTTGEADLRLLEPGLGFPFAEGIAHVDLDSAGEMAEFRVDGHVHVDNASYIGSGITATGMQVDAHAHVDPRQFVLTRVVTRLRQGGQIEGDIALSPWLGTPPPVIMKATVINGVRAIRPAPHVPVAPDPNAITVPVNGKVNAQFKGVPLDAILDIVSQPPFQRIGLDALVTGSATANWVKGDQNTVVADANLALAPSPAAIPGEAPTTGIIDATYTQKDGSADVRKLQVNTPASHIEATGHLGAYPLTSASGLAVDFHSRNLREFDTLIKDLGLHRYGKTGTAALPIALSGQGEFHGSWTGSIVDPHLTGTAKATQLALEMVPVESKPGAPAPPEDFPEAQPKFVPWDTAEATGSYAADRIVIEHGSLHRGASTIAVDGTLDATPPATPHGDPTFDGHSVLHMNLQATKVSTAELLNLAGQNVPITGTLEAQVQANGPIRTLSSAGTIELDSGKAWGEPVTQLRAQIQLSGSLLKVTSGTITAPAGTLNATGTYDLKSDRFQIDSKGAGIDIAKIEILAQQGPAASGTLGYSVTGNGTLEDPRLEAHATLNGLAVGGESLGALVFAGHTANRSANYNATTRFEGAKVDLNGETALTGNNETHARLEFSHFDIGGLLNAAHVKGLKGQSALAGTITVEGPLAHPREMHGDARLQQVDATIAGVHLASPGGLHATLAAGRINLDPLHITGEDTDLHAQGSLALKDDQRINFAAGGSVNLKLAETLDPDITAGGTSTFQVEAHGTMKDPGLQGRVDFDNGSLALGDVPNGLSQLHGTLTFNQNRLEVSSLTAMSGGGQINVGGYLAYRQGLFADLTVAGKGIRIRYPTGVSSLADTSLHLQGSRNNLLLSGDVLITRFSVSSDLDIAALAAQANTAQTIVAPDAPSNHIRLDVHVASSPQLNFQNAYAKLAGNVDLHLRGTVAAPSLLGRVSITEGDAIIAGTRYDLQRGDVSFTNPVRIEPSIDLNATARVEDYDITLGLHGTPQKLSVTYRSDPPLPEADVVALLALGRTENEQRLYTTPQEQYVANPTTDALLGGALNATVSSRVQKLFGAGSVKVDPNYIGTLGNSTSRITVEEQLGRNVTLTYATDVDTTGQQLLQAEVAINRHVSVLVARDESGVFSMVLKATRRYR
jgi:translocation and assembly module TamB